jgi:hypothetical protein
MEAVGLLDKLRKRGAQLVGEVVRYKDAYRLCYIRGPGRASHRTRRGAHLTDGSVRVWLAAPLFALTVACGPVTWESLAEVPDACAVTPSPTERMAVNGLRSGLWGSLPIETNPWTGTDRRAIARIREIMYGGPEMPDGPPLSPRELNAYSQRSADDVEQAFVAFFLEKDGSPTTMSALKFKERAPERPARIPAADWFQREQFVVHVSGDGACRDAIRERLHN